MSDGQEALAKTYRMQSRHYHWLFKAIPQRPRTYKTQLGLVSTGVTTVFAVLCTTSTLRLYYILPTLRVVHLT